MRRIHALRFAVASASLSLLTACEHSAPTSLQPTSAPSLLAVGRGGAVVTGGGQYTGGFGSTTVTVHAVRHADGTITGQYQQRNPDLGLRLHGSVDCVSTSGNRVFVSGIISNVQNPGITGIPEGAVFMLFVEDNGEGASAPPDRISPFIYGVPPFSCTNAAIQDFLAARTDPLESGNFQVTP